MNHTYHFIKQKRQQHHATNKIKQHSMNHAQTITPPKQTTSIHKKAAHQKGRFLWFLVILHRDLRVAPVVSRPTDSPHEKVTAAVRSGLVVEFLVNWNLKYNWKKNHGDFDWMGDSMRKVFGHVFFVVGDFWVKKCTKSSWKCWDLGPCAGNLFRQ